MRRVSTSLILLLAACRLTAQSAAVPAQSGEIGAQMKLRALLRMASCPVSFKVDRPAQGAILWVNSANQNHHGQTLKLSLANPANPVVGADVDVYGYAPGVFPATSLTAKEITETFHLTASPGHPLTGYTLWTDHMAGVKRVVITRIEYADGATWQPSSESNCSASPSLAMLVLVNSAR